MLVQFNALIYVFHTKCTDWNPSKNLYLSAVDARHISVSEKQMAQTICKQGVFVRAVWNRRMAVL